MLMMRPVALGQHARSALLALFVVSPLARESGRRPASTLCMASKSDPALPGWTTIVNQSIKKNDVAHKNFVQLATVTKEGLPAVRTVVFRGWMQNPIQDDGDDMNKDDKLYTDVHLKFITDFRSSKMTQGKIAEACWYFTETREQFRLRGDLLMVTHESTNSALQRQRSGMWKSISDSAREQYAWPAPGIYRPQDADDEKDFRCNADKSSVSDNFVLMLLRPTYIDHLNLRGFPQMRVIWSLDENHSWQSQSVNP